MSNTHSQSGPGRGLRRLLGLPGYARRALGLLWQTHRGLTVGLITVGVACGSLPALVALVGKQVVDGVLGVASGAGSRSSVFGWIGLELGLVLLLASATRVQGLLHALLRVHLGQHVTELVLRKALELELSDFDDPSFYDQLTQVQREASFRPLNLVRGALAVGQGAISLFGYALLLSGFSPWLLLLLGASALPAFLAEAKFGSDAFRLFRWRCPEARRQAYLETVLTRDDHAKEVKVFEPGPLLLQRHREIFERLYAPDRQLSLRRTRWGLGLGLLAAAGGALCYLWVAWAAMERSITLGTMTMLLLVLRQAQSGITSVLFSLAAMHEDNLYLSTLDQLLARPARVRAGSARSGPDPSDGIRFEQVSFVYPAASSPALQQLSLHIPPGSRLALVGANGSGKTTLVKLLLGLYRPTSGRILLDGLDLEQWDPSAVLARTSVVFQDFVRYQLRAGENLGLGDVAAFDDQRRWQRAAEQAGVHQDIERLKAGYLTQLGRWFAEGVELSLGQWQKIALGRAFMREQADILVFDEPTSNLDPVAEAQVLERLRELGAGRTLILVSHRLSSMHLVDRIVVLESGRIVEQGTHRELLAGSGHYRRLFELQARTYR